MTDNQETSADIIAEMRRRIAVKMSDAWYTQEEWRKLCDRLEAAHRRERGDCAKMREVLLNIKDEAEHSYEYREYPIAGAPGEYGTCHVVDADWLIDECNKGLAAPPRNCDVGTVAEQKVRFLEFCDDEKGPREHCRNCRLSNAPDCELAWAQMPYEEGGAK
jgi:mRNA-degrading endonuclease YafQ of YafQ-DinJ toxin-antitoxin module